MYLYLNLSCVIASICSGRDIAMPNETNLEKKSVKETYIY